MWVSWVLYSHKDEIKVWSSCSCSVQATTHQGLAVFFQAHGVVAGYLHCRTKVPVSLGYSAPRVKVHIRYHTDAPSLKSLVVEFPSC